MSYVGAVLSSIGGDCQQLSQVLRVTTAHESASITLHLTAHQRKRPRHRPGRRNQPWAPNSPDEAIPSHPLPTMGGGINADYNPYHVGATKQSGSSLNHVIDFSSSSDDIAFSLPPTLHHQGSQFNLLGGGGGGFTDSFRNKGVLIPLCKCSQWKHYPCRVCWRHSPQAPNLQESPFGHQH